MVKGRIVFVDGTEQQFEASYTKLRDGWFCIHHEKKVGETTFHQEFWPAHQIKTVFQDSDQLAVESYHTKKKEG